MQILKNENSHYQRFPVYEGNMFIHYEMCWEWQHGANIRQCELWLASGREKKKKKRMEWSSLETGQVVSLQCRHLLYLWMRWWRLQCTQEGHGLDFSTVETVIGWSFWYLTELHVYSGMQQQGSLCFLFTVPFLVVIWHLVDHARPWTVSSQALSHKNRALIMLFH